MFLLVLDKDPLKSANLVPDGIKFKQLLELMQLISTEFEIDCMKPIKQGKEIRKWIRNNIPWVFSFYHRLGFYCLNNIKLKEETKYKIFRIANVLGELCKEDKQPTTAVFRYSKDFEWFTKHPTNTELPIKECIKEYKKYVEWKKLKGVRGYV